MGGQSSFHALPVFHPALAPRAERSLALMAQRRFAREKLAGGRPSWFPVGVSRNTTNINTKWPTSASPNYCTSSRNSSLNKVPKPDRPGRHPPARQ